MTDGMTDAMAEAMPDGMADTWTRAENSPPQVTPLFSRGEFSDFPCLTRTSGVCGRRLSGCCPGNPGAAVPAVAPDDTRQPPDGPQHRLPNAGGWIAAVRAAYHSPRQRFREQLAGVRVRLFPLFPLVPLSI